MNLSDKNIQAILFVFQILYLIVTILAGLVLVSNFLLTHQLRIDVLIVGLFGMSFYWGIKHKQPWVRSLILIGACFGLISQLLFSPANFAQLLGKIMGLSITIFIIYFFSTKKVRKYFGSRGVFLFGR